MNPETIKKLREQTPEFKELVAYLAEKAHEMDTLEGLDKLTFTELAYEASVRLKAKKVILDILEPLLRDNSSIGVSDPLDYVV